MKFKKPQILIIPAAFVLIIIVMIAFSTRHVFKLQAETELSGCYAFDETIYNNPLSSFMPVKGYMPYFEINRTSLKIIDNKDGSVKEEIAGTFKRIPVNKEAFSLLFEWDFHQPDISRYKECFQYAVFSSENTPEYRLYLMDNEVWLANLGHNNAIWSIYKLIKTGDVKPNQGGGYIVPTFTSAPTQQGFQLEICLGGDVMDAAFISDKKSTDSLRDIIYSYTIKSKRCENIDYKALGDYFRFYDTSGDNATLYYAFFNEKWGENPQIQTNKDTLSRADMTHDQYEQLYALWESHMKLPESVEVKSGENSISASIYRENDEVDLSGLKNQLGWLKVETRNDICPFRVFSGGTELYGNYEIYDADSLEQLDCLHPSGLEPQTYILQNTKPGKSYIVKLSMGYTFGSKSYGTKMFFGITLP